MDRTQYRIGDPVTFEVKVENVGSQPLQVPVSPHLADLQPEDPSKKFGYLEMTISLWIGGRNWSTNHGAGATLYGSEERPDTMQTLQPGEWVRIVASDRFVSLTTDSRFSQHHLDDPVDHANARVSIFHTETLLAPTTSASVSQGMCLISRRGPDVPVTVTEAQK
jgi:hypothetical protein